MGEAELGQGMLGEVERGGNCGEDVWYETRTF